MRMIRDIEKLRDKRVVSIMKTNSNSSNSSKIGRRIMRVGIEEIIEIEMKASTDSQEESEIKIK